MAIVRGVPNFRIFTVDSNYCVMAVEVRGHNISLTLDLLK